MFDKTILADKLKGLRPDRQPEWGTMTPQHMIEHLAWVVRASNGKHDAPIYTPAEKLEKVKTRMMEAEWNPPVNFKAAFLPSEGLAPLVHADMDAAREALMQEIDDFYAYHAQHPDARPVHPYFGALTKDEWIHNHSRHFNHHLRQFGLV